MAAPLYQFMKIKNHDPRIIKGQLLDLDFNDKPIVLDIRDLASNQLSVLNTIEDFYTKNTLPKIPYSIYIICDCDDYIGFLYTVKEQYQLPQFFNKKNKTLTNKEEIFLNKIELKQENFKSLVPEEYRNIFNKYANGHRKISQKQHFQMYLETINKGLKDFYGKKEK